jgi:hypothetical protein
MDLKKYDVTFNSLDTSGDGALSWEEYNVYFSDPDRNIFDALDTDETLFVLCKTRHNAKFVRGVIKVGQRVL